jgi:hypothetical protein
MPMLTGAPTDRKTVGIVVRRRDANVFGTEGHYAMCTLLDCTVRSRGLLSQAWSRFSLWRSFPTVF